VDVLTGTKVWTSGAIDWLSHGSDVVVYSDPNTGLDMLILNRKALNATEGFGLLAVNPNIPWGPTSVLWEYHQVGQRAAHSVPTVDANGVVYHSSLDGHVHAIDKNGRHKWLFDIAPVVFPGRQLEAWSQPPLALGGGLLVQPYICNGLPPVLNCTVAGGVIAMSSAGGVFFWNFPVGGYVAGAAIDVANQAVYVGSRAGVIYALEFASGKVKWQYKLPANESISTACVIGGDGTVYCSGSLGALYAFSPSGVLQWATHFGSSLVDPFSSPAIGTHRTLLVPTGISLVAVDETGELPCRTVA